MFNVEVVASVSGFTVDSPVVPANERRFVDSILVRYVADVTAANRFVRTELIDVDGSTVLHAINSGVAFTANFNGFGAFGPGLPQSGNLDSSTLVVSAPRFVVLPGQKIRVRASAGGQAGDAIGFRVNYETQGD